MKFVLKTLALGSLIALSSAASAAQFTQCPAFSSSADTGCAVLITVNVGGTLTIAADSTQGPYDGSDDTLVGIVNNSGATISSITLSSSTAVPIFGFEGDGIDGYGATQAANNPDDTGYGGPISYYTNISAGFDSGTVNFVGGLADGASTYFSLEENLSASNGSSTPGGGLGGGVAAVPEPGTYALMLLGLVGVGAMTRRRQAAK